MATGTGMARRLGWITRTVKQPAYMSFSGRKINLFILNRFCHRARSSLYEHVREGYSDKPELDMRTVCEETHKVIANVEHRKGDLQGNDVRKIVNDP